MVWKARFRLRRNASTPARPSASLPTRPARPRSPQLSCSESRPIHLLGHVLLELLEPHGDLHGHRRSHRGVSCSSDSEAWLHRTYTKDFMSIDRAKTNSWQLMGHCTQHTLTLLDRHFWQPVRDLRWNCLVDPVRITPLRSRPSTKVGELVDIARCTAPSHPALSSDMTVFLPVGEVARDMGVCGWRRSTSSAFTVRR